MSRPKGWIAVDFDGTLATYDTWGGPTNLGDPVEIMVERVKSVMKMGYEVRVMTARCFPITEVIRSTEQLDFLHVESNESNWIQHEEARAAVYAILMWTERVFGKPLPVTCVKDYEMEELWDDRAVNVIKNTGLFASFSPRGFR